MTSSLLPDYINLLMQEESNFDNSNVEIKRLIKTQMDLLTQSIEKEMCDEERLVYDELYAEDCRTFVQNIKDLQELQKKKIESFEKERRERESKQLYHSAEEQNLVKFKILIKRGVDVNWQSKSGNFSLLKSCEKGNIEFVKILLNNKADINLRNNFGSTALMCCQNNLALAKLLVSHQAKINLQDDENETALMWACRDGHKDVASFLLNEKAIHTFKNKYGETACDYALRNGWDWNAMLLESKLSMDDVDEKKEETSSESEGDDFF